MKATNIMIGDWLHLHYRSALEGEVHKDFRVAQIRNDYGDLCVWAEVGGNMGALESKYGKSHISPIPLTLEILERNGWKWNERLLWLDDRVFALDVGCDGVNAFWWHMFDSPVVPINYVHELQHVLRVCGIEKEIVV